MLMVSPLPRSPLYQSIFSLDVDVITLLKVGRKVYLLLLYPSDASDSVPAGWSFDGTALAGRRTITSAGRTLFTNIEHLPNEGR